MTSLPTNRDEGLIVEVSDISVNVPTIDLVDFKFKLKYGTRPGQTRLVLYGESL